MSKQNKDKKWYIIRGYILKKKIKGMETLLEFNWFKSYKLSNVHVKDLNFTSGKESKIVQIIIDWKEKKLQNYIALSQAMI